MAMLRPLKAAHDDYSVVILAYVFCSINSINLSGTGAICCVKINYNIIIIIYWLIHATSAVSKKLVSFHHLFIYVYTGPVSLYAI